MIVERISGSDSVLVCVQLQEVVLEGHGGCRDLFAAKLSLDDSVVVVQRHEYILQVIVSDGESV